MRGYMTIPPRSVTKDYRAPRFATLVVIEFSAAWPEWLSPSAHGDMAIVAQHYEGHPSSLVTQVAMRATKLEAVGWKLGRIVLVTNGRCDADSIASRSVLARGLLARLKASNTGELLMTVDAKQGERAASRLLSLAATLERSRRGSDVILSLRIGDSVYRSPKPLADQVVAEERRAG